MLVKSGSRKYEYIEDKDNIIVKAKGVRSVPLILIGIVVAILGGLINIFFMFIGAVVVIYGIDIRGYKFSKSKVQVSEVGNTIIIKERRKTHIFTKL